ncbi:MAG: DeoR family transcriptional regulator, partial [Rhizobium sp.]
HHRIGHTALHVMADLTDFDAVITDHAPDAAILEQFHRDGIALTIASNQDMT